MILPCRLFAKSLGFFLGFTLLALYPMRGVAEWTEWLADIETAYIFQDNINQAMFNSATENEQLWNSTFTLGRVYQLNTSTRLLTDVTLNARIHQQFHQLNQLKTAANFAIQHKFGIGAYQPWIQGSVSTGYIFSKSIIREGQTVAAGIDIGKALHERFEAIINYRFDYRNSTHLSHINSTKLTLAKIEPDTSSRVFDMQEHSVGIQLNSLVTQQLLLALAYHFRTGDIVSSNSPGLVPQINTIVDAIAFDDALPGWAYRSNGETHRYSADLNYAFMKGHAAFNLGYEYSESHVSSFSYRNNLFRININYRF